jgi:hypothetical protein
VPELVRRAGVDLRQTLVQALAKLGPVGWPARTTVPVEVGQIPLKRHVLDVVVFRSLERVRERVFGPATKPDVKIPGKDTAARLGEAGRLYLHQCVTQFRAALMPETVGLLRDWFGPRLLEVAVQSLRTQLTAHQPRLRQKQEELAKAQQRLQALAAPIRQLAAACASMVPRLQELGRAFDHDVAKAPLKQVVIAPQPPRPREVTRDPKGTQPARRP